MYKWYVSIFIAFTVPLIVAAAKVDGKQERQIPVVISVEVKPKIMKTGESIPLILTVSNGLSSSIYYSTFSLTPNNWNGETYNVSLVDIYRDGKAGNLYLARPKIDVPITISGAGRREIKPGGNIKIQIDARKWKLRSEWLSGRYRITVRIDNLKVDEYSMLSVMTDPVEFEIK